MNKILDVFKIDISGNRVFGLDLLRCIAILLVMIGHSRGFLPNFIQEIINYFLVDGVAIFFVLSGFLIGGIIIKSFQPSNITLKSISNFWKRRWLRTLPNYYLILSILIIISFIKGNADWRQIVRYPFFLQNVYVSIGDFFPESWSLCIEEWFYTLTPLLLLSIHLFVKDKLSFKSKLLSVIIIVISLTLFYRGVKYFNLEKKDYYMYDRYFLRQALSRMDAIMFGVLGAWLKYYYESFFLKNKRVNFLFGVAILFLTHRFEHLKDPFLYILSSSFTSLGVLLMLPFMSVWRDAKFALKKPITYCSLISYSMYLVNLSLVAENLKSVTLPLLVKFSLFWILTIIISILLYKYFESPIMKWRDRVTKK